MFMNEEKPKSAALYVIVLTVTLVIMGYFLFFFGESTPKTRSQVQKMQELTKQVHHLESNVKEKQGEIYELAREYKLKTGKDMPIGFNPLDLDEKTHALFKQRVDEEKDVSVKSLLGDILEKNSEVGELKKEIVKIEKLLPAPYIVKEGDSHYQVAVDFLTNEKGVEKDRAIELVEGTALFDQLLAGFKVWNFYTGDEYGTSITQGTAAISPNTLICNAKKRLMDARDQAISQRNKLAKNIKVLEEKKDRVITQLGLLTKEKESLSNNVSDLNQQVNSLFYLLDSRQNLKKKGILKSSFLTSTRLHDVSPQHFNRSIDLRSKDQVVISASDLEVEKIKDVMLYPKFYKKGTDYKVDITADNRYAVLDLLEKTKFKNERVVIAVK